MYYSVVKYYVNKKRLLKMLRGISNIFLPGKPDILCKDLKNLYYMSFVDRKIFLDYVHTNNERNTKKGVMLCLQ